MSRLRCSAPATAWRSRTSASACSFSSTPRRASRPPRRGAATGWKSIYLTAMSDLKIFIADDEEPARERLKVLLGDIAAELPTSVVGEARHGVEAIERLPASGAQ